MLEKATLIAPKERITMAEMARELRACAAPPPEARQSASLAELQARMEALTAASRQQANAKQGLWEQYRQGSHEIAKLVPAAAAELSGLLNFDIHRASGSGEEAGALVPGLGFSPRDRSGGDRLLVPPGEERPQVEVRIAASSRMNTDEGPVDIAAFLRVDRILENGNAHETHEIFARTYLGIPIGSAQHANVVADIRNGLFGGFPSAIRQVIQIMSEARNGDLPNRRHCPARP